ncbi:MULTISPECIES: FxSxx-COOH cyclophane-containing RiPP peptide [unclassified Kitasatospora]|uniref:FxSxx-COOH cyclophane-containing RiPP peptide n=1 Tax=unclassified Kitasatospora TaxID=2633591 RepID=UPI002476907A|nr:FxSxx-COOH cyclophane-containing RiPP peptide [Kitasatospora sp. MAP12-44]
MPTTALDVKPVEQSEQPVGRMPLDKLSALGADRIAAAYARALPAEEAGQVAVAAFNSSI